MPKSKRVAGEQISRPLAMRSVGVVGRLLGAAPPRIRNRVRAALLRIRVGLPRELLVAPGEVVVQVGMWRPGNAVRLSRAIGPNGRALLIEAGPAEALAIEQRLEAEGLSNVRVVNAAAWHEETEMEFDQAETPAGSQLSGVDLKKPAQGRGATITVGARRVDEIAKAEGFLNASYVEVTVNGAELNALKGMPSLLASVDRLFVAGMMRDENGVPANRAIAQFLEQAGFRTRISRNGAVVDETWGRVDGHVFGWR